MGMNDFRVIELISGRKIAVKRGFFVFMRPHDKDDFSEISKDIDDGLVIINIDAVAVIREAEEHEIEWCKSFHF